MLKEYEWQGRTWQFDESDAPEGAVPVKPAQPKPAQKARATANKGRTAANKEAAADGNA